MSSKVPLNQLKQAYLQSANIVAVHGEEYLPIFERLENEYNQRLAKSALLTKAINISKSNDIK